MKISAKKILRTICFLIFALFSASAYAKDRPTIALVLSGGGAKGLAEIPLLEALEEEGIPIDMVLGTSMGSMIGALYAAGYTPREIREIFLSLDIMSILNASAVATQNLPPEAFTSEKDNIFSLNFTWNGIGAAPALLGDQNIMNMLAKYFSRLPNNLNFDELPIKYRAIATNLTNAEKVIYSSGSLPDAIRGSMSLPAVWTPAIVDRNTFVIDGGWVDNLPIQEAAKMGADIIIAMDVASYQESDPLNIDSIDSIAVNLFNLTISTSAMSQYELANVLLRPNLTEFNTLDFLHAEDIVKAGEICVRENRSQIRKLANELEKRGVNLEQISYTRQGEYDKLPVRKIESVTVRDISFREPCPLPKETDFQGYIGKTLDEKTMQSLIDRLNAYQKAYMLSSLSFAVLPGSAEDTCVLEIRANHYSQNSNRIIFGGSPSAYIFSDASRTSYNLNPQISSGLFFPAPVPLKMIFFTGESTGFILNTQPKLATYNQYTLSADIDISLSEGSQEPKSSPFYSDRTANDDILFDTTLGIQLRYANMFTFATVFNYNLISLHSNSSVYNLFSLETSTVWNTLDSISGLSGTKIEFMYSIGLSPNSDKFLYLGRFGAEQRFEIIRTRTAVGYTAQAAITHYPWQLNCGYTEYGGINGMPGYAYGTKKRDMAMVGVNVTHRLMNLAGMPLYLIGQIKTGFKDGYNAYSSVEPEEDFIFGNWNAADISQYDLGFGGYAALKTPIGNIVLGGSRAVNGNYCLIIALM